MAYDLSISSAEEEFAATRQAILAFIDTYGRCEAKLYEPETLIEEDGIVVSGEYGAFDILFNDLRHPELSRSEHFDEGRMWMKWVVVIYALD